MSQYYAYTRVSTVKQGEKGVSLQEQKDAITRYAEKNRLDVVGWLEERETAAKRGRPVFGQLMKLLRQGKANGVIIHKIDRSARNLKDWSDLGELIDQGVEVHFANESLDLHSRGGRLSADIQAVIAADYIRNLREEIRKGFYGRLKQGIYPLPAPVGYLDAGKGKPKTIDPVHGPLIRKAFELYATGRFTLHTLSAELERMGLRNRHGNTLGINRLSYVLNNSFYIGIIRLGTGEVFDGIHEPLVKKSLFDRVQAALQGKINPRIKKHAFLFRKLLACKHCGLSLIGERQKGHIYYRCHTRDCVTKGVREDIVERDMVTMFEPFKFSAGQKRFFEKKITAMRTDWSDHAEEETASLTLKLGHLKDRLGRLTDAFLDGSLDKEIYDERKETILLERKDVEYRLAELKRDQGEGINRLAEFLELAESLSLRLKMATPEEKRELLQIATSNRWVDGKKVVVELRLPFAVVAERVKNTNDAPLRYEPRTLDRLIHTLMTILPCHTHAT